MALDLTQKTEKPKQFTGARIFFGVKPPKNWRLNSVLQKDSEYQKLREAWDQETDPTMKEEKRQEVLAYKAIVRKKMNLPEEESSKEGAREEQKVRRKLSAGKGGEFC